jgi:Right handed beta helix region/PKD domain/Concanavalin A-like lectin/glucanases superfamily
MPITVSNGAQLLAAMAKATGGETIVLKAGDYGNISLYAGKNFFAQYKTPITITSEDSNNPAVVKGLALTGVANVTFDHIKFDYKTSATDILSASPFKLTNCSGVSIKNSEFDGDVATNLGPMHDGDPTGNGLVVTSSSNITLTGNDFHGFHRGAIFSKSANLTISANEIRDMSSDGLDFAQVKNVLIQGNSIHDFHRNEANSDHPDMIQFWTTGTTEPSSNIKIIDNFLNAGEGTWTQSIFLRNELVDHGKAGQEMFYQNVVIANNVIRNAHTNAITVGQTNNLKIDNNTLLQSKTAEVGGSVSVPTISVSGVAKNVIVTDNVTPSIALGNFANQAGWLVKNNYIAQRDDSKAKNFIGKLYSDALDKTDVSIADLQALDGSVIKTLNVGSTLKPILSSGQLGGYIVDSEVEKTGHAKHQLDVSHIYDALGAVNTKGATVKWNFGDGTSGDGLLTTHTYASAGSYNATATVTLANGKSVVVDKTIAVQLNNIFSLNFDGATAKADLSANGGNTAATALVNAGSGKAVDLNGGFLKYDSTSDFTNNKEYTVLVDFKKDAGQEMKGGRLVYLSGSYIITLGADSITVQLGSSAGAKTIKADKLGIADTDWHKLGLTFSGVDGYAKLYLDGKEVASLGGLKDAVQVGTKGADLYVGGPFGGSFGGQVDNVHIIGEAMSKTMIATADPYKALNDFHGIKDVMQQSDLSAFIDNRSHVGAHGIDYSSPTFDAGHVALASLSMITPTDFLLM